MLKDWERDKEGMRLEMLMDWGLDERFGNIGGSDNIGL